MVLFGTEHDTYQEELLFSALGTTVAGSKKVHWLCEGEAYNRKCDTLKDNKVHLLTDALFVNMLIKDFRKGHIDAEFRQMFYERAVELFVTMSHFQLGSVVGEYGEVVKGSDKLETTYKYLEGVKWDKLLGDMEKIVGGVMVFMRNGGLIDKQFEKCVFEFYENGVTCEDEVLTVMREKSFV